MGWFGKTEGIKEELAERLREASRTNNGDIHVIPTEGKWAVRKEGAAKSSKVLLDKKDAIKEAKELIKTEHSKVIVHNYDGTINKSVE